jgi:fibronectin type 3 domain-containing protein
MLSRSARRTVVDSKTAHPVSQTSITSATSESPNQTKPVAPTITGVGATPLAAPKKLVSITLAWNASTSPNIAHYTVYSGGSSGSYSTTVQTTNLFLKVGVSGGNPYYFAVTATDTIGLESVFSNEVLYKARNPGNK